MALYLFAEFIRAFKLIIEERSKMKGSSRAKMVLRRSAIAATLGAVMVITGCGENFTDAELVDQAKEFQDKGNWSSSIVELKNAIQQNPNNMEARWLLGRAYIEIGDGPSAEKELRRAQDLGVSIDVITMPLAKALFFQGKHNEILETIQISPNLSDSDKAELLALRGEIYLIQGDLDMAKEQFRSGLETKDDSVAARLGQARIAVQNKDLDSAREWIGKALEVEPTYSEAWSRLGDLESGVGDYQKAEEAYSKAIEYSINNTQDIFKRAIVRIERNDFEGAENDIDNISPNHPGHHYVQGLIHYYNQRFNAAQTAFENALNINSNLVLALFYLGASHFEQGRMQQAELYLNRYLTFVPRSNRAAKMLAQARIRVKDFNGAEAALKPVLERAPNDLEAIRMLANLHLVHGDTNQSIPYLRNVVASQPDTAWARTGLGLSLIKEGQREEGMKELEEIIKLDPQLQQPVVLLFMSHIQAREFDEALKIASDSTRQFPDDAMPHNLVGIAYAAKGDSQQARAAFEQALKLEPTFTSAQMNLARLDLQTGDLEAAEARYQQILEQDERNLDALLGLVRVAERLGRSDEALNRLVRAWDKNPNSLQVGLALVQRYLMANENLKALDIARSLQSSHPNDPAVVRALGFAQMGNGETESALATIRQLTVLVPDSPEPWHLLAVAQQIAQDPQAAHGAFDKALELQGDYLPSLTGKTRLYLMQERFQEALAGARDIQAHHASQGIGHKLEGDIYMQQRDFARAVAAYQAAYDKAGDDELALLISKAQRLADKSSETAVQDEQSPEQQQLQAEVLQILTQIRNKEYDKAIARASGLVEALPDSAQAHNLLGAAYRAKGDYERARVELEEALKLDGSLSAARMNLAELDIALGNPEAAERRYRKVLEQEEGHLEAMLGMAELAQQAGRAEEALGWLEKARVRNPDSSKADLNLVQHYLAHGENPEALDVAQNLQQNYPDTPMVLRALGLAQMANEQAADASVTFQRLAELEPRVPESWHLLGSARLGAKDTEGALKAFDKALELQDSFLPSLIAQTQVHLSRQQFEEALISARRIQAAYPAQAVGYKLEGDVRMRQQAFAPAVAAYQAAYDETASGELALMLSQAQQMAGDIDAAVSTLEKWLAIEPTDERARTQRAAYLQAMGRKNEAVEEYRQLIEHNSGNVTALNNFAWLLNEMGDEKAAISHAEKAIELAPDRIDVMDTLGWILVQNRQVERGLRLLQQATEQAPEQPTLRYHLAVAYNKAGQPEEARREISKVLGQEFPEREAAKALLEDMKGK